MYGPLSAPAPTTATAFPLKSLVPDTVCNYYTWAPTQIHTHTLPIFSTNRPCHPRARMPPGRRESGTFSRCSGEKSVILPDFIAQFCGENVSFFRASSHCTKGKKCRPLEPLHAALAQKVVVFRDHIALLSCKKVTFCRSKQLKSFL